MKLLPQVFAVVPPLVVAADDDPVQAYASMDEAVSALPSTTELGSPILPCQQPCIEVTVLDETDAPLADMPYRLLLEGELVSEGTLDGSGFVSVPEEELPPGDWRIEITLQRNESTRAVERADILLTEAPLEPDEVAVAEEVSEQRWLPFMEVPYPWE